MISQAFASTTEHVAAHGSIFEDPTFWTGIAFVLTFFVFCKMIHQKVATFLQERHDNIEKQLKQAEELRVEAQTLLETYTERLNHTEEETALTLETAKKKADEVKEAQCLEYEKSIQRQEEDTQALLKRKANEATKEIESMTLSLATSNIERILSKKISGEVGERIINEAIDSLPELFAQDRH